MSDHRFDYARVRHADRVLVQTLGGEAVLLDLKSEKYFGLNAVGTRVWQLIGETGDVGKIFETLVAEYDAQPEALANDLRTLLAELINAGLVQADA
ncbi:MAG: PqqD family protein [Vicinamibacterales bacterium]